MTFRGCYVFLLCALLDPWIYALLLGRLSPHWWHMISGCFHRLYISWYHRLCPHLSRYDISDVVLGLSLVWASRPFKILSCMICAVNIRMSPSLQILPWITLLQMVLPVLQCSGGARQDISSDYFRYVFLSLENKYYAFRPIWWYAYYWRLLFYQTVLYYRYI